MSGYTNLAASGNQGNGTAQTAVQAARQRLSIQLETSPLPASLKNRMVHDVDGDGHYSRMQNISVLKVMNENSGYCGYCSACVCCKSAILIDDGKVGTLQKDGEYFYLGCGYHAYSNFGTDLGNQQYSLNEVDRPITNGPTGFVTISEGRVGVLQLHGDFRMLAPGTYQWFSSSVRFIGSVDVTKQTARLGPYTLVTVADGQVAVTFNNGDLSILGLEQKGESRTFFLNDPKWELVAFLSMSTQTDRLEGNDLLSKDNVEVIMVAMSQWRIVDPALAVTMCEQNMEGIRTKVNQLVRAAIARIVAGTCIGSGPVSGGISKPVVVAQAMEAQSGPSKNAAQNDADLAHLMQSEQATRHMAELTHNMAQMGIEVIGVFVPEKRMKNDDIRHEVARQAVIGIQAEAERSAADAKAYATITAAKAEAQAINELADAHSEAGKKLGQPESTASRLALTDKTASALSNAKVTIFSGSPGNMPFMLNADTQMK